MKNRIGGLFLCLFFLLWVGVASADPLDLSSFIKDPEDADVVIDTTNGIITLNEDEIYASVYAANDYFEVPDNALELSFDYDLALGEDDFGDYLTFELNFIPIPDFDSSDFLGSFTFDLSPYRGQTISIAWGLIWDGDEYAGTTASISNIDLATVPVTNPVPEPATMLLLGSGLIGLAGAGRKKFFRKS